MQPQKATKRTKANCSCQEGERREGICKTTDLQQNFKVHKFILLQSLLFVRSVIGCTPATKVSNAS